MRGPVGPGAWLRVAAVALAAAVPAAVPAASLAQDEGLSLLPPLWVDDGLDRGVGGERPGEGGHGEGVDGPLVPSVAGGDDSGVAAAEGVPAEGAGQEEADIPPPPGAETQDAAMSAGVQDERETGQQTESSSLLGYLGDREGATQVLPVAREGGAAAALFGCPRSVLEGLLKAATARADVVSSLEMEREVLTLCGERQRLVVEILKAEAELGRLWRASRAPAPEARAEPAAVLAQLTEFEGARVVEFVEEPVEAVPEPEPQPRYAWFSIFGTAGDLHAGVSDGGAAWFVREGDALPGGVVVEWISVSPPGVHVMNGGADEMLPYRAGEGG